jgi:DNA-binding Lrp family transcriptional regulator
MARLDETDLVILQRLLDDARRSYRGIADEVGLSPPTVSNRVERLRDLGIIRRFTIELDRTLLSAADETLVVVETHPEDADDVVSKLSSVEGVEHVFQTVEARVFAKGVLSPSKVHALFTNTLEDERVEEYRVDSVLRSAWRPQLGPGDFDVQCAICGNTVSGEGESVEVGADHLHRVCCSSCAERVAEEYRSLRESADG